MLHPPLALAEHRGNDFEIVSIAMDVQGAAAAKPWVQKAAVSFTALIDHEARLAARFSLNYVPFSILIDETGRMVRGPQPANVADDARRAELTAWIERGAAALNEPSGGSMPKKGAFADDEAELRFCRAALLLRTGRIGEAAVQLRRALNRDPANWIIHKQIWAIEHPDRFYDGPVDFRWQREQLEREHLAEKGEGR